MPATTAVFHGSPLSLSVYSNGISPLCQELTRPGASAKVCCFSGSDIRCQIGTYSFAECQAVSYSVTREKAPLYTMGSPDPRAFSRNKRGIAGSLIWVNFDRHALLNLVYSLGGQFVANTDDLGLQFMTDANAYLSQTAIYQGTLVRATGQSSGATIDQFDAQPVSAVSGFKQEASPWYSDQILPFDITLAGTNEEGAASFA
jgi:hypothetical protein